MHNQIKRYFCLSPVKIFFEMHCEVCELSEKLRQRIFGLQQVMPAIYQLLIVFLLIVIGGFNYYLNKIISFTLY